MMMLTLFVLSALTGKRELFKGPPLGKNGTRKGANAQGFNVWTGGRVVNGSRL
ncbi:hypothetical protein [Blastomonas fulva]|uniref:hypothetical protein n=1 Tax=Blastomonas fulva TaxID=1550728 RepID=UPI0025A43AAA|nr:hypothetical protein [Blastomonas fulva]MDM7967361.1 hypothetical protein [Blastomonas fulva]